MIRGLRELKATSGPARAALTVAAACSRRWASRGRAPLLPGPRAE